MNINEYKEIADKWNKDKFEEFWDVEVIEVDNEERLRIFKKEYNGLTWPGVLVATKELNPDFLYQLNDNKGFTYAKENLIKGITQSPIPLRI